MGFDPISIGLMVAGTAISAFGAIKSQGAQQQQIKARQAMTNVQSQAERLDQVRQGRIKRAQVLQAGSNQGGGESTSVATGASGVQGQVESNIGNINRQAGAINTIFADQAKETNARGIESIGGAVQGIGSDLFDPDVQAGIKRSYTNIFGD